MSNITKNVATSQQLNIKDKKKENKISIQEKKMTNVANLSELKPVASNNKNEQSEYCYDAQKRLMTKIMTIDKSGQVFVKELVVSSHYIEVIAFSRNEYGSDWKIVIKFENLDNAERELEIPREAFGDLREVHKLLQREGFPATGWDRTLLGDYLMRAVPIKRITDRSTPGWIENQGQQEDQDQGQQEDQDQGQQEDQEKQRLRFACPSFQYPESGETYRFNTLSEFGYAIDKSKSLEQWQDNVEMYCRGNHIVVFGLCLAFSGILLKFTPEVGSNTFTIFGDSSTGKTTALKVACSVWGNHKFMLNWNVTKNALDAMAEAHNYTFTVIDEVSQSGKDIKGAPYTLANSRGKSRLNTDSTLKKLRTWRTITLSSGEVTIADKIEEEGGKVKAGEVAREICINADAGAGHGIFDTLHGLHSGAELADLLNRNTNKYYGTPAKAFVKRLIDTYKYVPDLTNAVQATFNKEKQYIHENFDLKKAHGQVQRSTNNFVLAKVAGTFAIELGVFKYIKHEDIQECMNLVFGRWLSARGRGAMEEKDTTDIVDKVHGFVIQNRARLLNLDLPDPNATDPLGFKEKEENEGTLLTGEKVFYLYPLPFEKEFCKVVGLSPKRVKDILTKKGVMKVDNDGKNPKVTIGKNCLRGEGKSRIRLIKLVFKEEEEKQEGQKP